MVMRAGERVPGIRLSPTEAALGAAREIDLRSFLREVLAGALAVSGGGSGAIHLARLGEEPSVAGREPAGDPVDTLQDGEEDEVLFGSLPGEPAPRRLLTPQDVRRLGSIVKGRGESVPWPAIGVEL